jgi:hypothetical protein
MSIHDPDAIGFDQSRLPMNWDDIPARCDLARLLRGLSAFREIFPGLVDAQWQLCALDDEHETAIWGIHLAEGALIAVLNRSDRACSLPVPNLDLDLAGGVVDLLTGEQASFRSGQAQVPAESLLVFSAVRNT